MFFLISFWQDPVARRTPTNDGDMAHFRSFPKTFSSGLLQRCILINAIQSTFHVGKISTKKHTAGGEGGARSPAGIVVASKMKTIRTRRQQKG